MSICSITKKPSEFMWDTHIIAKPVKAKVKKTYQYLSDSSEALAKKSPAPKKDKKKEDEKVAEFVQNIINYFG